MNWQFYVKKIIKSCNLTRRRKRKLTADRFKKHYHTQGFNKGYQAAKKELTSIIEHRYVEEPSYQELDQNHVVPPEPIDISKEDIVSFYREVFGHAPKNRRPNKDQCKLIFSQSRNTLAIAGAGSGKTTSLINRLLFLHKICHVPLEHLTVFSFTRASVSDFRRKLIEVFGKNGIIVSPEKSEQVIRTFHSKVLEMSRESFLKGEFKIFEFLKDKLDSNFECEDAESEYKSALKQANEEVVAISELNNAQSEILYKALDRSYRENRSFQEKLDTLFLKKLELKMGGTDPKMFSSIIRKTNDFEKKLAPLMVEFFVLNDHAQPGCHLDLSGSEYSQLTLSSDAYYPDYNAHIIFAPNAKLLETKGLDYQLEVNDFKQRISALVKRKAFIGVRYAKDTVYVVSSQQDILALERYLSSLSAQQKNEDQILCPRFSAKFDGDFTFKPITDVFFEIATFAESIGVRPEHAALHTDKKKLSETDKLLLEAVGIFWQTFEKELAENNVVRFNDLFEAFSTPHSSAFKAISPKVKRSLTNIIIDEFQDISPEVAKWIQATLRTLTQEDIRTSLMCVGDDFQSIYGWRGSSPEFLSSYETKFPSDNINKVFMSQNYRSYQSIVDTAESCLIYKKDFNKKGNCHLSDSQKRISFIQLPSTKHKSRNSATISAQKLLADIQQKLVDENMPEKDTELLVMAKTNAVLKDLKSTFNRQLKHKSTYQNGQKLEVQFETFHRSKGLEAKYCLLVEDCDYDNQHLAKNYLYKLAGFKKTFDEAQREEAMRLAYVAVTRAKEKVWWVTSEDTNGSFNVARKFAGQEGYAA